MFYAMNDAPLRATAELQCVHSRLKTNIAAVMSKNC